MDRKLIEGTKAETEVKRRMRAPLLKAFDVYKTNVEYGVMTETPEEHEAVLLWYRGLLDLDSTAIANPPEKIISYL